MRKTAFLLLLVFLIGNLFACGGVQDTVLDPVHTPEPAPILDDSAREFYERVHSDERPIAIMIDNDGKAAWPHSGLDGAYLIYEIVVEGGATRLMALYKGVETDKIGPVRSARHYFLDYVLENNAIYVHFGQSPKAQSDFSTLGINNINGVLGGDGNIFWREYKTKNDWHSAYTNLENIMDMIAKKNFKTEKGKLPFSFADEFCEIAGGKDAQEIKLDYSPIYKVRYEYSDEDKVYYRFMNSTSHEDAKGTKFTATNVVVLHVKNFSLGDGTARQELSNKGSGTGFYYSLGKVIPIRWSKQSRGEKTLITDQNGNEIVQNPGRTWVQLIPAG